MRQHRDKKGHFTRARDPVPDWKPTDPNYGDYSGVVMVAVLLAAGFAIVYFLGDINSVTSPP